MAINELQQRFVDEFWLDPSNAAQAAIRAGYSVTGAAQAASRLLSNIDVAEAIAIKRAERSERTQIDADWLLKRLADEATADVNDLYDDNGSLKPVSEWPLIWRQGLVGGVDIVQEFETVNGARQAAGTVTKIKLSDRVKRLELIGKHIGVQAFSDKLTHVGPNGGPVEVRSEFVFVPVGPDHETGGE